MPQSKRSAESAEHHRHSTTTEEGSQAQHMAYERPMTIRDRTELVNTMIDIFTEAFAGIAGNVRDVRLDGIGERGLDPEQRHLINRFEALRALTGRRGAALVPPIDFTIHKQSLTLFKHLPARTRVEVFAGDHSYLGGATVSDSSPSGSASMKIDTENRTTVHLDHVLDPDVLVEVYDQGHLKFVGNYVGTREDDELNTRSDTLA